MAAGARYGSRHREAQDARLGQDRDVQRLLSTPACWGTKVVEVSDICVRRYRDRHKCAPGWRASKLLLRQRLETGRYRQSAPAWLPPALARWDAHIELGGEALIGLTAQDAQRRHLRAVTWFKQESLTWSVGAGSGSDRVDATVELSKHAVDRYLTRVRPDLAHAAAQDELAGLIRLGTMFPESPTWLGGHDYSHGGHAAYYLVIGDWIVLPLLHSTRPLERMFDAVTCLLRDPHVHATAMRGDAELAAFANQLRIDELKTRAA